MRAKSSLAIYYSFEATFPAADSRATYQRLGHLRCILFALHVRKHCAARLIAALTVSTPGVSPLHNLPKDRLHQHEVSFGNSFGLSLCLDGSRHGYAALQQDKGYLGRLLQPCELHLHSADLWQLGKWNVGVISACQSSGTAYSACSYFYGSSSTTAVAKASSYWRWLIQLAQAMFVVLSLPCVCLYCSGITVQNLKPQGSCTRDFHEHSRYAAIAIHGSISHTVACTAEVEGLQPTPNPVPMALM